MIISISGRPGSGKSAVAKALAVALGFAHVSAGDFMREIAGEHGVSILELSQTAERNVAIDHEIDARTKQLGATADNFVIDARLAWHFLPQSVKIFLDVRPEVAAARIFGAGRPSEHENVDVDSTSAAIERRTRSEVERYQRYYGVDYLAPENFDLVIDTSHLDVASVVARIADFLDERPKEGEDASQPEQRNRPL